MADYLNFWAKTTVDGKPGVSVFEHGLNVGCVAKELAACFPAPYINIALAVWLAGCHDIGKISPGFQQKCLAWLIEHGFVSEVRKSLWTSAENDHSKVSQFTLQHLLRERFSLGKGDGALWAAAAGMHHGAPHWRGDWMSSAKGIPLNDEWDERRRKVAEELTQLMGAPAPPSRLDLDNLSALWWTAGLISVADWIGSDEQFFSPKCCAIVDYAAIQENACNALEEIGMKAPNFAPGRSFLDLFGFPPNDLQTAALETIREPGVYVIEAPMGMGKTEAALAAAYQLIGSKQSSGLYFALPTQATSNRIHERVAQFLHRIQAAAPRLVHGGSWLVDEKLRFPALDATQPDDQRPAARDWFASSKRALLAPFGVGTVDQALLGVIAVKHFFVRHFALAGKVVVLDEVHSYDVFTGTLIEALIKALVQLRCTVIILSATLTRERRQKLLDAAGVAQTIQSAALPFCGNEPFPMITGVAGGVAKEPRSVAPPTSKPPVVVRFRDDADLLQEAIETAHSGACVLWICNTVDRALATYRAVCGERREGDPPVGLLHSRFPFYRRQELEEDWMLKLGKDRRHRPKGCLLVSTQIVEQSVDLDADLLITELAPTDMLFQRLGRLWRHHKPEDPPRPRTQPEVWIIQELATLETLRNEQDKQVLCKTFGKKARVYAPYVLLRTLEQWHDKGQVHLPADIRPWLEATYQARPEEERPAWKQLLAELNDKHRKHVGQAETAQNVWNLPALKDEEGIGTRLNVCATLPLILTKSVDQETVVLLNGTSVPVQSVRFDYQTAKALHRNLVKAPAWWFTNKARYLKSVPAAVASMVALHLRGQSEIAVLNGSTLTTESLGEGRALDYSADCGLSLKPGCVAPPAYWKEDDDETYD